MVDTAYLLHASDRVLALGTYFVLSVGRKFVKDAESVSGLESYLGGVVAYELLQNERHSAMIELCDLIDAEKFTNAGAGCRFRVNGWLANKRLGRIEKCRKDIQKWDTSALDPLFKLAKHALLDELPQAHILSARLRASEDLPLRHWLTWPLLAELREYDKTAQISGPVEDVA